MKKLYIILFLIVPLSDTFSQQGVFLTGRDSIKLKKLGVDLFQDGITINKFQLENIFYHDRRYKVNKAFNIFFKVIAAPYAVLGVASFASIGRTTPGWRGLNVLAGVVGLGFGGVGYGISRPFRRGSLKNKFLRDRVIQKILKEAN
jgi:hypothetical protein